jgi:hypothetical protein
MSLTSRNLDSSNESSGKGEDDGRRSRGTSSRAHCYSLNDEVRRARHPRIARADGIARHPKAGGVDDAISAASRGLQARTGIRRVVSEAIGGDYRSAGTPPTTEMHAVHGEEQFYLPQVGGSPDRRGAVRLCVGRSAIIGSSLTSFTRLAWVPS